jgi:lysophospholipase L1-like esterase
MSFVRPVTRSVVRSPAQGLMREAGVIIPTTGLVANRGMAYTTTATIAANFTFRRERWAHPDGSITNIRSVDGSWYYNTSFVSTNSPASLTIKRYIEYPADVFHQVTWVEVGGTTSITLAPGVGARKSDIILSSITGLPLVIPAGVKFWERTVKTNASSTMVLMQNPANANVIGVDDGSSASDLGNSGTIAPSAGVNSFGALAYEGTINATNARSFVIVGDSLPFGTGDITSVGAKGGSGWVARMLDVRGYPYTKLTRGSQQSDQFVTGTKQTDLITALSFSDAIVTHGLNDLSLGSRQTVDILASLQTIYGYFTAKSARIYRPTLNPRTTSTDSWATTVNQTITSDGNMADFQEVQDALRVPQANVDHVIELADQCMPSRDANIWTAPPAATADGVHPNSTKVAAIAAALAPSIEL